ncbi:phage protein [Cupriavidus campinensis]
MGTAQYGRKASLIIGQNDGPALDLSELRFRFDVRRGDLQTPNSARVRVYNVSENTAQRIEREFTRVVLQAGYQGNYGIIFDGTLVQVRRGRESQTDTYLDLTVADGDRAYNFAVVNQTLAAGSTLSDHIGVCTKEMEHYGVGSGYVTPVVGKPLPRGKVMFGMARDFLRIAAKTHAMVWSIQDGKLQMVSETSYAPGEIPKITAETGMVGMPEQTQNGITIKMLLNPSIKIGRLIEIDNASVQRYEYGLGIGQQAQNDFIAQRNVLQNDGFYYVMVAEHNGDTRGNDFYTEAICLAADGTGLANVDLENRATLGVPQLPPNVIKRWG